MEVGGKLILMRDIQHSRLGKEIAHQLHSDWQSLDKPARHRQGRNAGKIGGDGVNVVQIRRHRIVGLDAKLESDALGRWAQQQIHVLEG